MMESNELEDSALAHARKQFTKSLIVLGIAIVYLISPIDLISGPPPAEWIEDIPILIASAVYTGISYYRLRRERAKSVAAE